MEVFSLSLFNKMLASIGIGSAKVDTKLSHASIKVGELVDGVVEIKGGNIEQKIDEIYLTLNTYYEKEVDDKKVQKQAVISTIKLNEPFVIMPEESKSIPVQFQLPIDTPISTGGSKVWIKTGMDIKGSIDPSDQDIINVLPHHLVEETLQIFNQLGFKLRKVKNEEASFKIRKRLPFIQEFEFVPTSGPYFRKFDEVEVIFFPIDDERIEIIIEVDRRARGFAGFLSEALDLDETITKITVSKSELATLKNKIETILEKNSI